MKIRFQLSALSQNDNFDSEFITATVTNIGGELEQGSFPEHTPVRLPIPPAPGQTPPPTPTWFLDIPEGTYFGDFKFKVRIVDDNVQPAQETEIDFSLLEVAEWAQANPPINNHIPKTNQIWQEGEHGIFGYAEQGSPVAGFTQNWIYTITAGVKNPKKHP